MSLCRILLSLLFSVPIMIHSMEKSEFRENNHTQSNLSGPIENDIDVIEKITGSGFEAYSTYLKNGDHLTARNSSSEGIRVIFFSHEFHDMRQEDTCYFWILKRIFDQST